MIDLLSLSGVYRIEEDPQIPGSEEMTWPFDYKVEVTRDEGDKSLYYIANDVTSGGETLETFAHVRDNGDGTYDLTYDEYGDGNPVSLDEIDEDVLLTHLNHLVNMDAAVKVSELPEEGSVTETETEETFEEDASDRYQLRDTEGGEQPWGAYDTKEKKFVQMGSKRVMIAAVNDLNKKKGLKESDLSDKVLDYIDSTYDKAINDNRAGMTEDKDDEADKAYICAHCGKKIVNGKGHAEDCWTQEMLKEDKLNYSPEMKTLKRAIKNIHVDSWEELRALVTDITERVINEEIYGDEEGPKELEESIKDSVVDRFKANEVDKISTEEVTKEDVIDDFLNYKDAADKVTLREGLNIVDGILAKQSELFESKKEKPARKRKRA